MPASRHPAPAHRRAARTHETTGRAARSCRSDLRNRRSSQQRLAHGEAAPSQSFQEHAARYLELADIRRALEGLAADRAINRECQAAKQARDVPAALAHNRAFRFGLYECANMPALLEMIERLWLQIGPTLNYLYPQTPPAAAGEHNYDHMLAALERRDGPVLRAAIDRSIDEGTAILIANMGSGATLRAAERHAASELVALP